MPPTTYSSFLRPVGSKRQSRAHKVFTDQPTFLRLASSNKRQSRAPSQEGFPQLPNPPSCVLSVASGKAERIRRTSNHSPASRQSWAEDSIDFGQKPPYIKVLVSMFLTFFGAKKEAKKHPPHPVLPLYWKAQHRKLQKPTIFFRFSIAGHAMSFFIGWRMG